MVKLKPTSLARIVPALALFSCAAPKAVVIEKAPEPKKEVAAEPAVPEPQIPALPDDGIRMPNNILSLPGDAEFKATTPVAPKTGDAGSGVIVRPPTDPPPRPKPKEAPKE